MVKYLILFLGMSWAQDFTKQKILEDFFEKISINRKNVDVRYKDIENKELKEISFDNSKQDINILGLNVPAKSTTTFKGESLTKIETKLSVKVDTFFCEGEIEFQKNKLCKCRLSQDYESPKITLPKGSTILFEGELLSWVLSPQAWLWNGVHQRAGLYSVDESRNALHKFDKIELPLYTCESSIEDNRKKIELTLTKMGIDQSNIKVVQAYQVDDSNYEEGQHFGFNLVIITHKPLNLQGVELPAETRVTIVEEKVRVIVLAGAETVSIQGASCIEEVELHANGKLCSCKIAKNTQFGKYSIKPPATVYFHESKFIYFLNSDEKNKKMPIGFYRINNSGQPVLDKSVDSHRCD